MELLNFEKYKSDFKWDQKLHFPVPTINYVMQRTGENLLSYYNTEVEANGALITLDDRARWIPLCPQRRRHRHLLRERYRQGTLERPPQGHLHFLAGPRRRPPLRHPHHLRQPHLHAHYRRHRRRPAGLAVLFGGGVGGIHCGQER